MATFKIEIDCALEAHCWLVEMSDDEDPIFTFKKDSARNMGSPEAFEAMNQAEFQAMSQLERDRFIGFPDEFDPWLMRERFFKIDDPADALEFLSQYGVWRFSRFDGDVSSNRFPQSWALDEGRKPLPIQFSELIYQRNYFEDALNCKPADWLQRASKTTGDVDRDVALIWEVMYLNGASGGYFDIPILNFQGTTFPGPFMGRLICYELQDALRATVLLDWMEGREWPRCKACRRVFKRTSKRPQFYCSATCSSRARQSTFRKNRASHSGGEV